MMSELYTMMMNTINAGKPVTTICHGKKTVWEDREEAKEFFLEAMISSEGSEYDRYSAIYMQIMWGELVCTDEDDE